MLFANLEFWFGFFGVRKLNRLTFPHHTVTGPTSKRVCAFHGTMNLRAPRKSKKTLTHSNNHAKKTFHRRVIAVPAMKMHFQLTTCQEMPNLGPSCIPSVVAQGWQKPSLSPSMGRMTQMALFWEVGLVSYPNHLGSIVFLLAIESSYMASRFFHNDLPPTNDVLLILPFLAQNDSTSHIILGVQ